MSNKEKVLKILSDNKEVLYSKYPIQSMAIFGSVSRNEQSENSDVDVLVEFNDKIGIRFIDLADEIENLLNQKVDLVSKNAVKPKYLRSIKKDLTYV